MFIQFLIIGANQLYGENGMQNAISEIIGNIPKGKIFDSHYIIFQLIKFYSDEYLNYASGITTNSEKHLLFTVKLGKK